LFAPHTYIFVLHAHPVRGESHNQRNTTGEVATIRYIKRQLLGFRIKVTTSLNLCVGLPVGIHAMSTAIVLYFISDKASTIILYRMKPHLPKSLFVLKLFRKWTSSTAMLRMSNLCTLINIHHFTSFHSRFSRIWTYCNNLFKMLLRFHHAYYYNLVFGLKPLRHRLVSSAFETETHVLRSLLKKLIGNGLHFTMIYYKTSQAPTFYYDLLLLINIFQKGDMFHQKNDGLPHINTAESCSSSQSSKI